jgi:putative ABC transport system permease protein
VNLLEALRMAAAAIRTHKLRSFLTLLGIIFGVATVIVVVTLIEGFNQYVNDKVADMGSNAFVVTRYGIITSVDEFKQKEKRNRALTLDEVDAILANKRHVANAAAMSRRRVDVKVGTKSMERVRLAGVTPSLIDVDKIKVGEGYFIQPRHDFARAEVAFVGIGLARELFPTTDPIGQEIKAEGRTYRIIGVAEEIGTVFGEPQDNFAYIPLATYMKAYGSLSPLGVKVSAVSAESMDLAVDEVRSILRAKRHIEYDQPDTFDIVTPDGVNKFREQLTGTISVVALGVTSIALVVGGIVIMNIMLVSVTERTREIGVRKSLGARRVDILKQFLAESTLLSLLGGALGVAVAYGLAQVVTMLLSLPTALPIAWTLAALGVSAGVGMFFGIYPAWRAAGLDPIVALRAD